MYRGQFVLLLTLLLLVIGTLVGCKHSAEWHFKQGDELADQGRYDEATKEYTEAIRLNPDAGYQAARALVYIDMEQYEKAIADYDEAIHIEPDSKLYYYRGELNFLLGKHKQAIKDLDEAIRLTPTVFYLYLTRGAMYSILGRC